MQMEDATPTSRSLQHRFLHALDYFFVLRPTLFFPVWTVALAGLWAHERAAATMPWYWPFWPQHGFGQAWPLELGLFTLVMGASFLLNQITDVESDRLNDKLYLVASGAVPSTHAWTEIALLVAAGLGGLYLLNKPLAVIASLAFGVTGWTYSCAPLFCKNRPWAGLIVNLLGAYLIFSFGWVMAGPASWRMVLNGLPYIFGIGAVYLLTTIPDLPGDAAAHKITVAVRWGEQRVGLAALAADSAAVLTALLMQEWLALAATALVWPFFLATLRRKTVESALQTNKYATLILSLLVCWRFPFYLALLAAIFFFSKWYYAARFQVQYPSLRT